MIKHKLAIILLNVGGHDTAGYSTINGTTSKGFVINLEKMNAITVTPERVVAQAGTKWGDMYTLLNETNSHQLITGGLCPTIGIAGYVLGGGCNMLSRQYGLGSDNIISMRMVTANGSKVVFINETVNPDLFFALRGSGGGNFGIVTEFTFHTHTVTNKKYAIVKFSFEAGTKSQQALTAIGQINSQLPREMYLDLQINVNKELSVSSYYLGSHEEEAAEYLKTLMDLQSSMTSSKYASYYALWQEEAGIQCPTVLNSVHPFSIRGCILKNLDYSVVNTLFSLDLPSQCMIGFLHFGGAIADVPAHESAFAFRHGDFEYHTQCLYENEDEEQAAQLFEDQMYASMTSGGHCLGSYVNSRDRLLPHWQVGYYGSNYPRLLQVKEKWNPLGIGSFHFLQEIGSTYSVCEHS